MRRKGRDFPASSATPPGVPRAILATLHFVPNTVTVPALAIRQGILPWVGQLGLGSIYQNARALLIFFSYHFPYIKSQKPALFGCF